MGDLTSTHRIDEQGPTLHQSLSFCFLAHHEPCNIVHKEDWYGGLITQSNKLDGLFGFIGEYHGSLIGDNSYVMAFYEL
jgi:hypothetical protein